MADLLDIEPTPAVVKTKEYGDVNVHGLSISGLAGLVKQHPELFQLFNGEGNITLGMDELTDLGVEVVASFLAAGLGYEPNNPKALERCKKMNPEDAFDIGTAIFDKSFPGGAANFFERVVAATKQVKSLQASAAPAEKSSDEKQEGAS